MADGKADGGRQIFVRSRTGFPLRGEIAASGRQIAWGISVSHALEATGLTVVRFSAWALRTDQPAPAAQLLFCNKTGPVHAAKASDRRLDVMKALSLTTDPANPVTYCGFRGEFFTVDAQLSVMIEVNGILTLIGEVEFPTPGVVAGQDNWLFLAGDTNDSMAQHKVDYQPTDQWTRKWNEYFLAMRMIPAQKKIFVVAPAKEAVMPERHLFPRRAKTPITYLMDNYADQVLFPKEELRTNRDFTYVRTDTHWSDYGARIACETMLSRLNEDIPAVPMLYSVTQKPGDLGDKLVPAEKDRCLVAAWPGAPTLVFDNLVLHHGSIRVWSNPHAMKKKTLIIFGGSSSDQMIPYLGAAYSRIVSIYSVGSWDPEIIAKEKPDIVILQTNERFLVIPPAPYFDCLTVARQKISSGHVTARGNTFTSLQQFANLGEDWYLERHLSFFVAEK